MKSIRIGIVGAGFAARYHVECLRRTYGARIEITGVTSLRKESREKFGATHGIPTFDNVDAMLTQIARQL